MLETCDLNFGTGGGANSGFDYFIQCSTTDIATFRVGDSFAGIANFTFDAPAVPGPLPLFGIAAAFGCSRRLRKRLAAAASKQLDPSSLD